MAGFVLLRLVQKENGKAGLNFPIEEPQASGLPTERNGPEAEATIALNRALLKINNKLGAQL